jgi:HEPN domain-containing protein
MIKKKKKSSVPKEVSPLGPNGYIDLLVLSDDKKLLFLRDIFGEEFENYMDKNEKIIYWIELSNYDLETAEAMLQTKRFLYVGFMCHQSIEKLLKAVFVQVDEGEPPRIHNLTRLARKGHIYDSFTEEQKDFLDYLEPLNIEARYPAHKEAIMKLLDKDRCENMLLRTKELSEWIKNKLSE